MKHQDNITLSTEKKWKMERMDVGAEGKTKSYSND